MSNNGILPVFLKNSALDDDIFEDFQRGDRVRHTGGNGHAAKFKDQLGTVLRVLRNGRLEVRMDRFRSPVEVVPKALDPYVGTVKAPPRPPIPFKLGDRVRCRFVRGKKVDIQGEVVGIPDNHAIVRYDGQSKPQRVAYHLAELVNPVRRAPVAPVPVLTPAESAPVPAVVAPVASVPDRSVIRAVYLESYLDAIERVRRNQERTALGLPVSPVPTPLEAWEESRLNRP